LIADDVDVIKEIGGDDLKFIFIRDEPTFILEALYVKGFSEEKYRKLRKYIKEKLNEEFSGIITLNTGKALTKVLLVGGDQVGQSLINDLIDNEASKISMWISNGVIKELVDKVSSEVEETKKIRKSRRKRSRRKRSKSSKGNKGKRRRSRKKRSRRA
jgi:hypothetical protein